MNPISQQPLTTLASLTDYSVAPYTASTLLYMPFDALPLLDVANGVAATVTGTPVIVDGVFGNALQLNENYYVNVNELNTLIGPFSIAFWLAPTNPGMVTNPITAATEPVSIPLFSKGAFSTAGTVITSNAATFLVYEQTQSDGTNVMKFFVSGLNMSFSQVTATLTSSPYATGVYHHFVVQYTGTALQLYCDLNLDTGATVVGSVPVQLNTNTSNFQINFNAPGNTYGVAKSSAILDDLVISNTALTSTQISRMATMGAGYICSTALLNTQEITQALTFSDPSNLSINGIVALRGNLYVARNDGLLLKGTRSIWDSQRDFSDSVELDYVTVVNKKDDSEITITNGIMTLTNQVIQL